MIVKLPNAACYLCLALPRLHPRTTNRDVSCRAGLEAASIFSSLVRINEALFKHCFDLGSGELVEPNGNKRLFNK